MANTASDFEAPCAHCRCETNKKCSGCKVILYCSKECQREHWKKYHKHECLSMKNLKFYNCIVIRATESSYNYETFENKTILNIVRGDFKNTNLDTLNVWCSGTRYTIIMDEDGKNHFNSPNKYMKSNGVNMYGDIIIVRTDGYNDILNAHPDKVCTKKRNKIVHPLEQIIEAIHQY